MDISELIQTKNSFFEKQLGELDKNLSQVNFKKSYINIDSSKRNKADIITTNKINTIDDYIKIFNNNLDIIVVNPKQLDGNSKTIPDSIQIIFNWVSINGFPKPKMIFGLNSRQVIYDSDKGKPEFTANMVNYDYDTDRSYYRICNLKPLDKGYFYPKNKNGYLELRQVISRQKGYPNPNQYKINFQQSYKNVVGINLKTTEFPVPSKTIIPTNDECSNFFIIEIPEIKFIRNFVIGYYPDFILENILEELVEKIEKLVKQYSIYPLLYYNLDQEYFYMKLLGLEIPNNKIIKIDHYRDIFFLNYQAVVEFPFGCVLWMNFKDEREKYSGIYRIIDEYYYKITIKYMVIRRNI